MRSWHFRSARISRCLGVSFAVLLLGSATTAVVLRWPDRATAASTAGYWLAGTDGGIFSYGEAQYYGSTGDIALNYPIVSLVATPSGLGYWLVAGDGGIFAFGDAGFYGSMGGQALNKPIVAMAATKTGRGYWLLSADGGIFAFGDAGFYGSMGGEDLNKPMVDIASSPTGRGYWLVATDGGIFAFGDAGFFGSVGADLAKRIQAMAPTPSGRGYWLVAGDGGVFAFGDAGFFGSASGNADKRVVDMAPSASGNGYYVVASNGQVLTYGDANAYGGAEKVHLNTRITSMAAVAGVRPVPALERLASTDEDVPLTVDVLANDRGQNGRPLTLKSVNSPRHGTATAVGNRASYQPAPDYHGPDSFTYTAADDAGNAATGQVNITVKPVDDKPVAQADAATGTEGTTTTIPVLSNDTGLGDGVKAVMITSGPGNGMATVNADQTLTYAPAERFGGTDSLEYRVTDVDGQSSVGKVKITLTATNHIPVAVDDSANLRAGRSTNIEVAANDDSPDGFAYVKFADATGKPTEAGSISTPARGTAKRSKGKFLYTAPRGDFSGTDSFTYVVVDDNGDVSNPATVTANVGLNAAPTVTNGSTPPVTAGQQLSGSIASLGRDPEGDPLSFILKSAPAGQIDLRKDGTFTYQAPTDGAPRTDVFTFVVDDGNRGSNPGTITIEVTATPPPQPQSASA